MAKPVSVVLVGLGGYGEVYLKALLDAWDDAQFDLVGAVEPTPTNCSRLDELRARGVRVYTSLESFYEASWADLVVIASTIHCHCAQTCSALLRGSHVLCEKPPAATVQEVDQMIAASEQAGRWVAVGYQWSFSAAIQRLKRDIKSGLVGRARRLKSLCLWPRTDAYYRRNDWAGRLRGDQGQWILDSPVNNAMAHDLHNMLYVLGDETHTSAQPAEIVAELYRANDIENCDTVALRVRTEAGVEILFYGSHAVADETGPVFSFEFDRATARYSAGGSEIEARLADGSTRRYASPDAAPQVTKLWMCISAIAEGGTVP